MGMASVRALREHQLYTGGDEGKESLSLKSSARTKPNRIRRMRRWEGCVDHEENGCKDTEVRVYVVQKQLL